MPADQKRPGPSAENRRRGNRAWRFSAARDRIEKIVDGAPPLTSEQLQQLAAPLLAAAQDRADDDGQAVAS